MNTARIDSPIGRLTLAQEGEALLAVRLAVEGEGLEACATPLLREAERQLLAYFSGALRSFDLPLAPQGSAFDQAVWRALCDIPYGEVRSYGEIAAAVGRAKASRAVGGACSRNPLLIVVPCHRVVGASGRLTGFAAGMSAKRALLALEGWRVARERINR